MKLMLGDNDGNVFDTIDLDDYDLERPMARQSLMLEIQGLMQAARYAEECRKSTKRYVLCTDCNDPSYGSLLCDRCKNKCDTHNLSCDDDGYCNACGEQGD